MMYGGYQTFNQILKILPVKWVGINLNKFSYLIQRRSRRRRLELSLTLHVPLIVWEIPINFPSIKSISNISVFSVFVVENGKVSDAIRTKQFSQVQQNLVIESENEYKRILFGHWRLNKAYCFKLLEQGILLPSWA